MNFNGVIGQKDVINSLINSLDTDKVGHAYIFSGAKGIGKRLVAGIFAQLLMCGDYQNGESCGQCLSCRIMTEGSNPDFRYIDPEGSSISIEEIRNLQSDVMVKPLYSKRKVYLIADADRMTVQAQNCLLKTLEEPPPYVTILLTASNYDALMETIRSRTIRHSFRRNTDREVEQLLQDRFGSELKGKDFITAYANGVMGTALDLAGSEEFVSLRERTFEILLKLKKSQLLDIFGIYDFFEANKNSIDVILDMLLLFYRDLLIVKNTGKQNILINSDKKDMIVNNAAGYSTERLIKCIDAIGGARINLKQNANFQLAIEVMLMKLQEDDK